MGFHQVTTLNKLHYGEDVKPFLSTNIPSCQTRHEEDKHIGVLITQRALPV